MEDAAHVRPHDGLPVVVGHAREQAVAGEARVVDEDVELARLLHQTGRLGGIADVRLHRAAAGLACHLLGLAAARPVADDDRRPGAGQLGRDRAADPPRAAGDERLLALEGGELRH